MKHLPVTVLVLFALLLTACQSQEHVVLVSSKDAAKELPAHAARETSRRAVIAVLDSLTDDQKKTVLHDIKAPLRKDWHFIPRDRQGLKLGDMTNEQKALVRKLMQTALSDSGYLKATDIIWLESVLYEMSNQNPVRDPGKYVLQIFGDPADEKAAWGWRLEGHHLSLNLTYTPVGIGVTPLFFGASPAVVQQGPLAGKRVLADAHNLAVELAKSMNDEQRKKMVLGEKPRDVISGPGREQALFKLEPRLGIPIDRDVLTLEQMDIAQRLEVACFYENFEGRHLVALARQITGGEVVAPDDHLTTFVWAGPIDEDEAFYFRIHAPTYIIEYSCQGKNHVHCVIHDLTDPLQEDLLKKHFEQHEHE